MKTTYIWLSVLFIIFTSGCKEEDMSMAKTDLLNKIQEVESILLNSEEGINEGNYAPGAKSELQTSIDWAYFILENSFQDTAYVNAVSILDEAITNFQSNVVKAGIPNFSAGSKMNLGPCGDWKMEDCFTFECKVRYNEFAAGDQNIISCEGGNGGWMVRSSGNIIQFYINDLGSWNGCTTSTLELNRWYHVAVSYQQGEEISLYLDGKKVSSSPCNKLQLKSSVDLQLGTSPAYADRYMRGCIQQISLWNDVRSEQEISSDVQSVFEGTEEGLEAYWPLDLNLGTEITDATGKHITKLSNIIWIDD